MESKSSLPVQYGVRSTPDMSQGPEKKSDRSGAAQIQSTASQSSFQSRLNEIVIDVYERSEVNTSVPDERIGADRRRSATRRHSSSESGPSQSGNNVNNVDPYSTDQKTYQTYTETEKIQPAIFSPFREKGKLVDTWA
jgi:hypothetical protein